MKYFIGLDIGTNSVGYAVTDTEYNIQKYKGNGVWGVNLFDSANQCDDTRTFRSARRRLDRKKQRVLLLRELFAHIIDRVDKDFYKRLDESKLYMEDKTIDGSNNLFNDVTYTDIDYHKEYPTIHHLIVELMNSDKEFDPRLVYLACAYILSHRGHFLIEVDKDNLDKVKNIDNAYNNFMAWFDTMEIERPFECDMQEFANVLKYNKGIKVREKEFKTLLFGGKKIDDSQYPIDRSVMLKLISGGKAELSKLFKTEEYKELENKDINLTQSDIDDKIDALAGNLNDGHLELIIAMKAICDWSMLANILGDGEYTSISQAKVEIYNAHKSDLKNLKYIIKKYAPDKYYEIFRLIDGTKNNYTKYVKNIKSSKIKNYKDFNKLLPIEEFCKYIKGILDKITVEDCDIDIFEQIKTKAENNELCPKQVDTSNRVIPYQLYYDELKKILQNASKYIPELNNCDKYGTVVDKILSIMTFRIPYYVGPLVDKSKSKFAWMVRKNSGRILPWNFDDMVDKDESENEFIRRMTCKCTYIAGEDVLPKNSLLYCKYTVLNEINNIKINERKLSVEQKQDIYNNLFKKYKKVTRKKLEEYLITNGYIKEDDKLSGVDININSSLKSYHDFKRIITDNILTESEVEEIIARITITTDKARFKKWLSTKYNKLSEDDIKYISRLKYKDYGRLSARFLTEIKDVDEKTGEIKNPNIITMLWETNNNLMMLLSSNYNYTNQIQNINAVYYNTNKRSLNDMLDDMYVSNAVKRPILRSIDIIKEIIKIKGYEPEKLFIEMARDATGKQKGNRSKYRRDTIEEFLSKNDDVNELLEELNSKTDDQLRSEKLYLYFMQLGRCMYSNEKIELKNLFTEVYDIDHIYPQSRIKDDSLDNKVLVKSELNRKKKEEYPINCNIRSKMYNIWTALHKNKAISDKKYYRLTRSTPFTDDELAGFINRQLVETRQSTKALATILKEMHPNIDIVYVKAGLASEFRHTYDLVKCRDINDYHHAKDAYLNIVMGNVYDTKFTKNPVNFIKEHRANIEKYKYSMKVKSLLEHDISRNEVCAWKGDGSTLARVKKTMSKNNIRYVKYTYKRKGGLFDQNPLKASANLVNLKKDLPSEKYGGYNKTYITCFILTKYYTEKSKGIAFIPLEIMYADKFNSDINFAKEYTINTLKNIVSLRKGDTIKDVEFPLGKRIIKINTLLDIDGFKVYIAQKSNKGKTIVLGLGESLIVDEYSYNYIQKITSVCAKLKEGTKQELSEENDKITVEDNIKIYDLLIDKINNNKYSKMFSKTAKKFENGKNTFLNLDLQNQVKVLTNMILVLKSGRTASCDLRLIGDVEKAATISMNSVITNIKNIKSIRIIDQSPTGLYEKVSKNLLEL